MAADNFFARWSRPTETAQTEKAICPAGASQAETPDLENPNAEKSPADIKHERQPVTMEDVEKLTQESDYSAFLASGVDENVKRSAMKKLFTDPHYNVMDGLDIYISDYSLADPIPPAMLAALNHSKSLLDPLSQLEKPLSRLKDKVLELKEKIVTADEQETLVMPAATNPESNVSAQSDDLAETSDKGEQLGTPENQDVANLDPTIPLEVRS